MNQWVTANAFAQRELATAISPDVTGCTVSVTLRAGLSGSALKLVFEEAYGKQPAEYLEVTLLHKGQYFGLTVNGSASFTAAPGERVVTDAVPVPVTAGEELTLFIAVGGQMSMSETSLEQRHSAPGNFCRGDFVPQPYKNPLPGVPFNERLCGLKELLVETSDDALAIVALGDSVTESAVWLNPLAEAIAGLRPNTTLLNLGIGGNRLLRDTNVPAMMGINAFGKAGLSRLKEDIFTLQGVRAVILALGANDIAQPGGPPGFSPPLEELCTVEELTAGLMELAARCRERGLSVIGATITPFKDYPSYSPVSAEIRNRTNDWIRSCGLFDYVLDFAALLADPADPEALAPGFGLGDGLHPNPAGGAAAVSAIDIKAFLAAVGL